MSPLRYNFLDRCLNAITIVIVGHHLSESAIRIGLARLVAVAALIAALFSLALPTTSGYSPEIAAVLAVGSLAFLAGHAWGLLVVALADVMLLGKLWPLLFHRDPAESGAVIAIALAGALPGLLILSRTLPRTVDIVLGRPDHALRRLAVYASTVMVGLWLTKPLFF